MRNTVKSPRGSARPRTLRNTKPYLQVWVWIQCRAGRPFLPCALVQDSPDGLLHRGEPVAPARWRRLGGARAAWSGGAAHGGGVELRHERLHATRYLVSGGADLGELPALGIFELPVEVALARY